MQFLRSILERKERGSNVLFLEPQGERERERERERRADRVVRAAAVLSLTTDFVFPVDQRINELYSVEEPCDFFAKMG